jgi:cyanophycinase
MKLILILLLVPMFSWAQTKLFLVGGGKRPPKLMQEFVLSTPGMILIIPWASAASDAGQSIQREFQSFGAEKVNIASQDLSDGHNLKLIQDAQGIFFTGGDQNKLMGAIAQLKLVDLFKQKFLAGVSFGGTSAGTAIMSNPMLTGNGSEISEGLGLLPGGYLVDQHFIVRNRWQRLANIALAHNLTGIGIDEDNALVVIGNYARVIGPTHVELLTKRSDSIHTQIITEGEAIILSDQ